MKILGVIALCVSCFVAGVGSDPDGVASGTGAPSSAETGKGWYFNTSSGRFSAQGRFSTL